MTFLSRNSLMNEPGNPRNIVQKKNVKAKGEELRVGDTYDVELQVGTRRSCYEARLLGIGERCMYIYCTKPDLPLLFI